MNAPHDPNTLLPTQGLYHYTSLEGLYGIINDGNIWATKIRYMNDSQEFRHSIDLAHQILFQPDLIKKYGQTFIDKIFGNLNIREGGNICVASFTENGDLLSQWRAYSGDAPGYSLRFEADDLLRFDLSKKFKLRKCIYDVGSQKGMIRSFFDQKRLDYLKVNENKIPTREFHEEVFSKFDQIASLCKDPAFKEEREWRLVSAPLSFEDERFKFRKSKSSLLPYYEFPIRDPKKKTDQVNVDEIICGPNPNFESAERALRMFLWKHSYRTLIEKSKIPLRQF